MIVKDDGFRGNITVALPDNQLAINGSDFVILSCDPLSGNIQPSEVFTNAIGEDPVAILLYSTSRDSCALTGSTPQYNRIYTMTSTQDSEDMIGYAKADGSAALIASSDVVSNVNTTEDNSGSGQSDGGRGGGGTSFGPSPSTAVAMIM